MKKVFLLLSVFVTAVCAQAQKTQTVTRTTAHSETNYQFAQARMPQVLVQPIVQPLIGEVKVLTDKSKKFRLELTQSKVERDLDGKLENIHNYGIYMWTDDADCDMIVGATYNFYTNPNAKPDGSDYYILEIKGFPANFIPTAWRSCKATDYDWMRITGAQGAGNQVIQPTVK